MTLQSPISITPREHSLHSKKRTTKDLKRGTETESLKNDTTQAYTWRKSNMMNLNSTNLKDQYIQCKKLCKLFKTRLQRSL